MMEGYEKGEKCNRNGCEGTIQHEREGGCSCHINPPCGYCTDDSQYCDKCGWTALDERDNYTPSQEEKESWGRRNEEWQRQHDSFYEKYHTKKGIEKLEMRHESHTHFSQIIKGIFPTGTETRDSIIPRVKGSCGGRFKHFGENTFEFVAYTD